MEEWKKRDRIEEDKDIIEKKNQMSEEEVRTEPVSKEVLEKDVVEDKKSTSENNEKLEEHKNQSSGDLNIEKKEIEKKQNSQIKWAIFLMIAALLIILVVPFIMKNYVDKFDYKGLDFQKTKMGDLIFYSVKFPVISGTGEVIGDYAVNFRNDPRDLEYIDVNITNGTVKFVRNFGKYGDVYISIDDKIIDCDDAIIAMASLSGFLGDSGLKIKSAVLNKTYAKENNETFINCWDSDVNTVIKVMPGNETRIREAKENCYEIIYKDCEILQASEKFMMVVLEEYANRFIEK